MHVQTKRTSDSIIARTICMLAALTVTAVGASRLTAAEESGWGRFFPSTKQADESAAVGEAEAYPSTEYTEGTQPTTTDQKSSWMVKSPLANVSWPEIKMPKIEFRAPWQGSRGEGDGWMRSPLAKARSATRGAIDRTRTAWNNTVEKMKFSLPGSRGPNSAATQVADTQNPKPSFWQRLMGGPEATAEPDDVVEMMAQDSFEP